MKTNTKNIGLGVLLVIVAIFFLLDAVSTHNFIKAAEDAKCSAVQTGRKHDQARLWGVTVPLVMGIGIGAIVVVWVIMTMMKKGGKSASPGAPAQGPSSGGMESTMDTGDTPQ